MLTDTDVDLPSTSASSSSSAFNPLEQFILLAKTSTGAACVDLIKQVLEAPGVYVFGELLAMANIQELEAGADANSLRTLRLFAYGTYREYEANRDQLLTLTAPMLRKLQHLTIVSMAVRSKRLPYDDLLPALGLRNVRDLEDLLIDAIYADIVHGKLDQRKRHLECDYAIGRDVRAEDVGRIADTLQLWSDSCATVLHSIDAQIERANDKKSAVCGKRAQIEEEIGRIRTLQRTQQQTDDEAMASECQSLGSDLRKRMQKGKAVAKVPKVAAN